MFTLVHFRFGTLIHVAVCRFITGIGAIYLFVAYFFVANTLTTLTTELVKWTSLIERIAFALGQHFIASITCKNKSSEKI